MNKRLLTLTMLSVVSAISFGLCPALANEFPSKSEVKAAAELSLKNMLPFASKDYGFSLKYPANWGKLEPKEGPIVCKFIIMGGLASFRVATEKLPEGTSLDEYYKVTTAQLKQVMASQKMPITVVSENDSKLASLPAKKSVYTFSLDGSNRVPKAEQYLAIKGNRGYVFNYTADGELFDDFHGVIESVINSMEIQ